MDSSVGVDVLEMSSVNVNPKSVEEVELQVLDPNSSKMTPNSQGNTIRTNRDSQEEVEEEDAIANKDVESNVNDSTRLKEPEEDAITVLKGNFPLIFK